MLCFSRTERTSYYFIIHASLIRTDERAEVRHIKDVSSEVVLGRYHDTYKVERYSCVCIESP